MEMAVKLFLVGREVEFWRALKLFCMKSAAKLFLVKREVKLWRALQLFYYEDGCEVIFCMKIVKLFRLWSWSFVEDPMQWLRVHSLFITYAREVVWMIDFYLRCCLALIGAIFTCFHLLLASERIDDSFVTQYFSFWSAGGSKFKGKFSCSKEDGGAVATASSLRKWFLLKWRFGRLIHLNKHS